MIQLKKFGQKLDNYSKNFRDRNEIIKIDIIFNKKFRDSLTLAWDVLTYWWGALVYFQFYNTNNIEFRRESKRSIVTINKQNKLLE